MLSLHQSDKQSLKTEKGKFILASAAEIKDVGHSTREESQDGKQEKRDGDVSASVWSIWIKLTGLCALSILFRFFLLKRFSIYLDLFLLLINVVKVHRAPYLNKSERKMSNPTLVRNLHLSYMDKLSTDFPLRWLNLVHRRDATPLRTEKVSWHLFTEQSRNGYTVQHQWEQCSAVFNQLLMEGSFSPWQSVPKQTQPM